MYLENIHLTAGVSAQHAALMVDHYGNPTLRDLDDADLRTSMAELARYDNVAVKLSGGAERTFCGSETEQCRIFCNNAVVSYGL